MSLVIVSGSAGLIGSETVRFFANKGLDVIGIDNDMRADCLEVKHQRNGIVSFWKRKSQIIVIKT